MAFNKSGKVLETRETVIVFGGNGDPFGKLQTKVFFRRKYIRTNREREQVIARWIEIVADCSDCLSRASHLVSITLKLVSLPIPSIPLATGPSLRPTSISFPPYGLIPPPSPPVTSVYPFPFLSPLPSHYPIPSPYVPYPGPRSPHRKRPAPAIFGAGCFAMPFP